MPNFAISPSGDAILMMTLAEAKGLGVFAGEGASGLLDEHAPARAPLGGPAPVKAAERALKALNNALANAARSMGKRWTSC